MTSFHRLRVCCSAYIVWSLTLHMHDEGQLKPQIDALVAQAQNRDDAYFLGVVAGILHNVNRPKEADKLVQKVCACASLLICGCR